MAGPDWYQIVDCDMIGANEGAIARTILSP